MFPYSFLFSSIIYKQNVIRYDYTIYCHMPFFFCYVHVNTFYNEISLSFVMYAAIAHSFQIIENDSQQYV